MPAASAGSAPGPVFAPGTELPDEVPSWVSDLAAEVTRGAAQLEIEREIFGAA